MRRSLPRYFRVVTFGRCLCRVVIVNDGCGVFCVAPGFLGDAFDLLGCASVGEFLVADCFADALLDLACYLIEFTCLLFLCSSLDSISSVTGLGPGRAEFMVVLLERSSTGQQLKDKNDEGNDEQDMDLGSQDMKSYESEQP